MMEEINKEAPVETDWKDKYMRLYADFDNHKKRVVKEKEEIKKSTKVETLNSVLELDNDLHIAMKFIKDPKSLGSIKLITDKLSKYLKTQGIEEIQTENYDENLHEVISLVENSGTEQNSVIDVVSKGYSMNGSVIKYPKIILSK